MFGNRTGYKGLQSGRRLSSQIGRKDGCCGKAQISSEMTTASLLTTGQMFLRLGLATVIVVGNSLVVSGDTSLFTYILF